MRIREFFCHRVHFLQKWVAWSYVLASWRRQDSWIDEKLMFYQGDEMKTGG